MNKDRTEDFLIIIENNKGIIYKIANLYCKNIDDRKDLIQEIVIQLWKAFENYDDKFKYSTWIYRIALNVSISFYRKENSRKRISNSLDNEILIFQEETNFIYSDVQLNALYQMINELKDLDKALMLLYLEEKSYREISQIIGVSETNISTKINRIKNILKQKLTK